MSERRSQHSKTTYAAITPFFRLALGLVFVIGTVAFGGFWAWSGYALGGGRLLYYVAGFQIWLVSGLGLAYWFRALSEFHWVVRLSLIAIVAVFLTVVGEIGLLISIISVFFFLSSLLLLPREDTGTGSFTYGVLRIRNGVLAVVSLVCLAGPWAYYFENRPPPEPVLLEMIEKNKDLRKIVAAIEAGAELNEKSNKYFGYTALHEAVEREDLILVEVLVKAGADPNIKTGHSLGRTPLHIAAALSNDLRVLELLIGTGAEIEVEDRNGRTPLYHAIRNGNPGAVEFLLENGATTMISPI